MRWWQGILVAAAFGILALPALAVSPAKNATYGGGALAASGAPVIVSAKTHDHGRQFDIRLRVRCRGRGEQVFDITDVKYTRGGGAFNVVSGGLRVRGAIGPGKLEGTIANAGGCKPVEKDWSARDVDVPYPSRGRALKATTYYGENATVQDLFDAQGVPGPLMLRTSKDGKAVTRAFMRAAWTCFEGDNPAETFFDNQDLAKRFRISKKGRFGRTLRAKAEREDGTVTVFTSTFKGRFARGKVKGTWREVTEHKPTSSSNVVLGRCDTGVVKFAALP